ncbi:unknown [Bacteroides sp. CAG:20]|nr:unknown [Bacteroides sp. CAG:20]
MGRVTEKWSWLNLYMSYNECIVFVFNHGTVYTDNLLL